MKFKLILIHCAITMVSIIFYSKGIIRQPQSYHLFADSKAFLGIPNAMNVLTNVLFIIVGLLGLKVVNLKRQELLNWKSWLWFFLSISLIGPGSAYYHWSPNDFTLIWDRLPMSMGFMAMYVALVSEHINLKLEKFLSVSLILGIGSVIIWAITGDLRFYFIVQFSSFVTVPLILVLFHSRFTLKRYYVFALAFYALAKWTEVKDGEIYEATNELISGHSLKHILAAAGLFVLCRMVKNRELIASKTSP
jgi:hypothetical protein